MFTIVVVVARAVLISMFYVFPIFDIYYWTEANINSRSDIHDKLCFLGTAHMTRQNSLLSIVNNKQNSNKTCKMIINTAQMVAIKQCIKLLVHVKISVDISVCTISKNTNFQYCKFHHIGSRYFADPIYWYTSTCITCQHYWYCICVYFFSLSKFAIFLCTSKPCLAIYTNLTEVHSTVYCRNHLALLERRKMF